MNEQARAIRVADWSLVSELVTGDAVVLDIRLARPATRALALGIDLLVAAAGFAALSFPLGYVAGEAGASQSLIAGLTLFVFVLTFVGYPTTIETLSRGKSVGKYALGLRVVRDDGGTVRFRHALVRALAGVLVDFFATLGCGALLTALLNPRSKRIGDLLAGTVVVRERAPRPDQALPDVPAELATWATGAELSRVPDDLAMSARSYLSRFHELTPGAREALGDRLAGAVAEYVSPPPPPYVPAWAYLAAILGERRRRALDQAPPQQQPDRPPFAGRPPTPPDNGFAPPR